MEMKMQGSYRWERIGGAEAAPGPGGAGGDAGDEVILARVVVAARMVIPERSVSKRVCRRSSR